MKKPKPELKLIQTCFNCRAFVPYSSAGGWCILYPNKIFKSNGDKCMQWKVSGTNNAVVS